MLELKVKYSTKIDWRTDAQFEISDSFELYEDFGYILLKKIGTTNLPTVSNTILELGLNYRITFKLKEFTTGIWSFSLGGVSQDVIPSISNEYDLTFTNLTSTEFSILASNFADGFLYELSIEELGFRTLNIEQSEIALTKELQDIRQFNDKSGEYSKDFNIPFHPDNDNFFKDCFEISTFNSFNPNKKIQAIIYDDGIEQIRGFLVLNLIVTKGHQHYYNVNVFGGGLIFFNELKKLKLNDLDWSDMLHVFNYDNIIGSWYDDGKTAQVAGEKFVYPVVDYGQQITESYLKFGNNEDGTPGVGMLASDFRALVYMKTYFDKIHEALGYTYDGDFILTDEFLNMAMTLQNWEFDPSADDFTMIGGTELDVYRGGYDCLNIPELPWNDGTQTQDYWYIFNNGFGGYERLNADSSKNLYDNFSSATYIPTQNIISTISGTVTAKFYKINYNIFGVIVGTESAKGEVFNAEFRLFDAGTGDLLESVTQLVTCASNNTTTSINFTFRERTIKTTGVRFESIYTVAGSAYLATHDIVHNITNVGAINTKIATGQSINFENLVHDMYQIDLIKSIITAFNLFTYVDIENKNITYSSYDEFYDNGTSYDWSDKIDRSQEIKYLLGNEFTSNRILLTHQTGENYWSGKFTSRNKDRVIGNNLIFTGNEFETDEYKIETIFGAFLFDSPIPNMYVGRLNQTIETVSIKMPTTPSIGFYKSFSDSLWYIDNDGEQEEQTIAPSFTAWLDPKNLVDENNFLLNFAQEQGGIYANSNGTPSVNLQNKYWSKFLANFIDKDARVLKAYFDLNKLEYSKIKLNEKIHIDGTNFIINKISDFKSGILTEIELVKKIVSSKIFTEANIIIDILNDGYKTTDPIVITINPNEIETNKIYDGGKDVVFMEFNNPTIIEGGENDVSGFNQGASYYIDGGENAV